MTMFSSALLVVVITAGLFSLIGILYARRRVVGIEDYVVSRNTIGSGLATATLVASGMGAWILFSPVQTGASFGILALLGYALGSAAPLLALLFLGQRMRELMPQGHSLTEYVWHRYGRVAYPFVLAVILFYMFVFLSAELTGIALAVGLVVDAPLFVTSLIVGLATAVYTSYGGLKASVFTDGLQFTVIIPILLIVLILLGPDLGDIGPMLDRIREVSPELLDFGYRPGIEFGLGLILAILAANLFHQGYWQRIYACRNNDTLRRAFFWSAVLVVPIVFLSGLFGLIAVGSSVVENPSIAFFHLVVSNLPTPLIMLVLVLAVALVMSSMDTLINGLVSLFASDLARINPGSGGKSLLTLSRGLTVVVTIPAIIIASQGYDVLYMFLVADLAAAGAVFPVFFGLYSRHFTGTMMVASMFLGILGGLLFFPTTDFAGAVIPLAKEGNTMWSFLSAILVSGCVTLVLARLRARLCPNEGYDFDLLSSKVSPIDQ